MKRICSVGVLTVFAVLSAATIAAAATEAAVPGSAVDYTKAIVVACSILAAALVMALGTIGTVWAWATAEQRATPSAGILTRRKILITAVVVSP
jgi:hypothetical protein